MFDRQVTGYAKLGVDRIEANIVGRPGDPAWNGYLAGAQFGYNMELSESAKARLRKAGF